MIIDKIERLSSIKPKSKIAAFGFAMTEETFYFFSDGFYFWKAEMDILEDCDPEEASQFRGTTYLDPDSIKKITEAFTAGSVEINVEKNELTFSQGGRKLSMTFKERHEEPIKPRTGKHEELFIGKLSKEIIEQAKIRTPYSDKRTKSLDNILILNETCTAKVTKFFASVNKRIEDWHLFGAQVKISTDILLNFGEGTEISQVGSWVCLKDEGLEVYMPEIKEDVLDCIKPFQMFQEKMMDSAAEINTEDLINLTNFTNKIYGSSSEGVCLKFIAGKGGFKVETSDINSVVEDFVEADHDYMDEFTFYIAGKLLANIKHICQDRVTLRISLINGKPLAATFFSGDTMEDSDASLLITLLNGA